MAVCCDIYVKELPNKYKGQTNQRGKVDDRETVEKVCIAFLTTEQIEIDGVMKPRYVSYWGSASMGTVDYPSNVRKFLMGWFPTLKDAQVDAGFDLDRLIGQGAYITITNSDPDAKGKVWANIRGAMQPPPGAPAVSIPADFVRHKDKEAAESIRKDVPAGSMSGDVDDLENMPF